MRKITICLWLLLANALFSFHLFGVTAYPEPFRFTQPDGKSLTIQMMGDELINWAITSDGYTIMFNKYGFYEYAVLDKNGDMMPSGIIAQDYNDRSARVQNFVSQIKKALFYSEKQISIFNTIRQMQEQEAKDSKGFPATGNRRLIVILMATPDKPYIKTKSQFENLFNQIGYNAEGAQGSVKDLYLENSRNQLTLTTDVVGPYTASQNMAYYGNNTNGNARALITEAVNSANPAVNYANYDNDNDGSVDGIYVIFAGHGEEAGGGADCIWSHKSGITTVTLDGKKISTYACSPELRGGSGTNMTHIGVICHEFGHVMGSRDFYDTNGGTGGGFTGTGSWDLMAGGSWNGSGATPAHHNPFNKVYLFNWSTATTLTSAQNITVQNAAFNNSFYRVNTTTANEYFLIENRQKTGFDVSLPGHGLLIFHVNQNNLSNQTHPQGMYPVCASATTNPGAEPSTYGSINSGGCPFPGTSSKTSFTDATTPNMKSWAGANNNMPITNIVESNGVITFSLLGGLRAPENPANTVNGLDYKYYHGDWNALPNFNALTPVATGTINNFNISGATQPDYFGFAFTGYVSVPTDGLYTFYTTSDDGSKLYIGTTEVVANDGIHANQERSGQIGLKAGKHAVRVEFFEKNGGNTLTVNYQGPGISKQAIPSTALYRVPVFYSLIVDNGNGDGNYTAGASVNISANTAPSGQTFDKWIINSGNPTIANINSPNTTLTMPANNAKVTASYKSLPPAGYTWCAYENGSYNFTNLVNVAYGANGQFNYLYNVSGNITFNNTTFGDPIPGVAKYGYYKTVNLRTPENPANALSGLDYKYYQGAWSELPDFNALTPVEIGNITNFNINGALQDDNYGFVFKGFVNVPTDGLYTFYTTSDDGSKLFIGSTVVVANDGLHGTQEQSGQIALKAGKHAIRVEFFERTGGNVLQVSYQGPGISKQLIPNSALHRVLNYSINDVYGSYVRQPLLNSWHAGVIELSGTTLQWRNSAGVTWPLIADLANGKLSTTSQCPYYNSPNGNAFVLKLKQNSNGTIGIQGFWFLGEFYAKTANVALSKSTSQSSNYTGGDSYKAVDGNTNGNWANGSVTHTLYNAAAWWKVNFGGSYDISSVTLWNRTDCCGERLSNFHVDYLDQNGNVIVKRDFPGTAGIKTIIDMPSNSVYAIRVQLYGTNYLSLAEVEVAGVLTPSKGTTAGVGNDANNEMVNGNFSSIQIYPNPVADELNVIVPFANSTIMIINATGVVVKEIKLYQKENKIHVSDLPTGIYLIQVKGKDETNVKRFIKQ